MSITFHKEEVDFNMPDEARLQKWLEDIVVAKKKSIVQLTYIFCSDEYLLEINQTYLNHDYFTDIITFPYKQGNEIESDIFVSIDRIEENAKTFDSTFEKELLRVMAHGVLHLLGYKDKSTEEQAQMRDQEDWALELFYTS